MKRVSLYLSMLLAAVFSLSAVTPVKTSTADDPVWYTIANPRFNGGQINEANGALTKTAGFTEGSFWRFQTVGDDAPNAVYIINYQTGNYLMHPGSNAANPGVTSSASSSAYWYLIEQPDWGVTGWIISTTGQNTGTNCLDASNASSVFSGGWHASSGDYEGTTWVITEVSNDAARESFFSNFTALKQPVLLGEAGWAQLKAALEAKFQVADDPVSTYINMAAGVSEARTIYNATYPQLIKENANGKSFSFYMPVASRNAGYLVPTADGTNLTTSGTYSASAIWTVTVNDDNTIAIQNLPTGKYAVGAQGTSQAWTLSDTPSPLSIYLYDIENTITLSKVNPGQYEYLHKGAGNVVGWGTGADASKWIIAEADLQPIVDEANAQINGALANKDVIIAGLTATGLWSDAELKEFVAAVNDITPLNVDDYETPAEIAQAVDAKLAAVTQAFALVSTKTFAVYNIGCGLTDNAPAYLGVAGNSLNTIAAPTATAQWSFDVVNGSLVLVEKNVNARTYLAGLNGSDFSTATASANALPIIIAASTASDKIANQITITAEAGALSCSNGDNLTTGDAASANAQWVLVELTGSILTLPGSTAAIEDLNFVIGSYNRGGYLTTDIIMPGAALTHSAEGPYSYWKLVPTGNENGYYIKSSAASFYIGANRTITDEPVEWFVLPTGVNNCGVAISSLNPISGACCIDANNYNNGVGAWLPSANDWQGSTWVVAAVSEGTVEDALDGVNPAEGVAGIAENVVDNLAGVAAIYSPEAIEQIKGRIDKVTNDESLTADERIAAIGKLIDEAVAGVCGKPFMLANVRRMNRAIGDEVSAGINTLSYIAVNNGGALQMSLVTPGTTSVVKFENAGSGKVKIAGMNVGPYYIYDNSTDEQASFCLVSSLDAANPQGINVDLSAAGNIVQYNANDAGSRWVMIDPFNPFTVPVKGADHYAVFTSYNRGGVLTARTALGVDIENPAVQHTDVTLGSFWAVAPASKPGYYTLRNALNDLYLANDLSFSETPAEWYIAPNAGNPEGGLALSPAPEGQCIDASNAGPGVSLWKPSANDWQGTTWIVASYAGNVANMAAKQFCETANLNSIKNDLNRIIPDTPWGVSALSQGASDCETFKGGADFKGDYIAAARYVIGLQNEICANYFNASAQEAAGAKVLLQSIRRTNSGKAVNTLTVDDSSNEVPLLGLGAAFDDPNSTWYVEASDDEGYFTLHTESGFYLGNITTVSGRVTVSEDPSTAAKFYFWPVLLGGDNSGIAIIDAATGLAMNVDQQNESFLVGYYYNDGGSTWKIIPTSKTSGIDEVELGNETFNINDADVELFNLQGVRINAADAAPGIYIARKAGVVLKVRKF